MRRKNLDVVRKREELFVQRVVHHSSHGFRCVASPAGQIRSSNVAYKKRVASENLLGTLRDFRIGDEYADAFGSMTRCFKKREPHFAQHKFITIPDCAVRKLSAGLLAENYLCSG